jgi:hypothetical protein
LNAKYFILPLQNNQTVPVQNPYVYGNAWFVDHIGYVNNANQEIDRLGKMDLRHQAVADEQFKTQLGESKVQDTLSVARITTYEPNHLIYDVHSDKGGILVFSEIYYPGWTATVDGQPAKLGRVDYVLRALNVSAGHHQVVLDFHPSSVAETETVAYVGYVLLLLFIALGCFLEYRKKKAGKEVLAPTDKDSE